MSGRIIRSDHTAGSSNASKLAAPVSGTSVEAVGAVVASEGSVVTSRSPEHAASNAAAANTAAGTSRRDP